MFYYVSNAAAAFDLARRVNTGRKIEFTARTRRAQRFKMCISCYVFPPTTKKAEVFFHRPLPFYGQKWVPLSKKNRHTLEICIVNWCGSFETKFFLIKSVHRNICRITWKITANNNEKSQKQQQQHQAHAKQTEKKSTIVFKFVIESDRSIFLSS